MGIKNQVLTIISLKYLRDEQLEISVSQLKMGVGSSMEKGGQELQILETGS